MNFMTEMCSLIVASQTKGDKNSGKYVSVTYIFDTKCSTRIIKSNIAYQLLRDFFSLSSNLLQD